MMLSEIKNSLPIKCGNCLIDLNNKLHLICDDPSCRGKHVYICPNCFFSGVEFDDHLNSHAYIVKDESLKPLYTLDWTQYEEVSLIHAIKRYGLGNWQDVAEHVRTKNRYECEYHYWTNYVDVASLKLWCANLDPKTVLQSLKEYSSDINQHEHSSIDLTASNNLRFEHFISNCTTTTKQEKIQDLSRNDHNHVIDNTNAKDDKVKQELDTEKLATKPDSCLITNTTLSDDELIELLQPILPEYPERDEFPPKTISKGNVNKDDRGLFSHMVKKHGLAPFYCNEKDMPSPQRPVSDLQGKDADAYAGKEIDYIPYRNDFSVDWCNGFEEYIAEMNIKQDDNPIVKKLKIEMLRVYDHILLERDLRKDFIFERDLLDVEKNKQERAKIMFQKLKKPYLPFARFLSTNEMDNFINSLKKQIELRKKIRKFKEYRKNGIKKIQEIDHFENELWRRRQESKKRKNILFDDSKRKRKRKIEERTPNLNLTEDENFELLTEKEQERCIEWELPPAQYIIIKDAILREATKFGYLSEASAKFLFPNEDVGILKECLSFLSESFSILVL